jgi:hypothetical protein
MSVSAEPCFILFVQGMSLERGGPVRQMVGIKCNYVRLELIAMYRIVPGLVGLEFPCMRIHHEWKVGIITYMGGRIYVNLD